MSVIVNTLNNTMTFSNVYAPHRMNSTDIVNDCMTCFEFNVCQHLSDCLVGEFGHVGTVCYKSALLSRPV